MESNRKLRWLFSFLAVVSGLLFGQSSSSGGAAPETVEGKTIGVSINSTDGTYTIFDPVSKQPILRARAAAEVDHHWLSSADYPHHTPSRETAAGEASSESLSMSNTGLPGRPDLVYSLQLHTNPDFVTVTVKVLNRGTQPIAVQAFRSIEAIGPSFVNLGGLDADDRILSDSFSEDRPGITIHNLPDATEGMHRAVGSQLLYNLKTKRNLFLGTLTSDKFLTILRLHVNKEHITAYEVDTAGTTELAKANSLQYSPPEDQVELSLPVAPGADLSSEQLLVSSGTDYHQQLETYGDLIRQLHHARVSAPSAAGWWSWTAFYFGLDQGAAVTNATWLAENLRDSGYNFFHIDEGYQYARGEYTTADANLFPDGMAVLESRVRALGLNPGIWTAPFEVSERSWIFENHKDWLVHNAAGLPIHAGWVIEEAPRLDPLFVLDCTNPGAQEYLRKTYTTLAKNWGIRYIKLDFMDDSAIEGFYHKPNTTALEAQRIGLQIIREAVGEDVLLDKDGSPMLNPVGIVDTGRISVDTGHTFESSKEAASGIAARYFMNRNFYVADPDAFTVSRQTVDEQEWHGGKHPLGLSEAQVSIALAAIAGGMYEIGDDLPTLGADPDRVSLVKNEDLMNMALLGRASQPLDLMSYTAADGMPSVFLLRQSKRQTILTVFNWTEKQTSHHFDFRSDLGLQLSGGNQVFDIFDSTGRIQNNLDNVAFELPPHSVKVLKIIDTSVQPSPPTMNVQTPKTAEAGKAVHFFAHADPAGVPALNYLWDFGDGTSTHGATTNHTYTHPGNFTVRLSVSGLDHIPFETTFSVNVTGKIYTRFVPSSKKRLVQTQ